VLSNPYVLATIAIALVLGAAALRRTIRLTTHAHQVSSRRAVQWLADNALIDDEAADRFLASHSPNRYGTASHVCDVSAETLCAVFHKPLFAEARAHG
jgi:hypothetical protein